MKLTDDVILYLITFLTIDDIINFSQTNKSFYSKMNQLIYHNVRFHNIYFDYQPPESFQLNDGEFIITCHKEVAYWHESDEDEDGYWKPGGGSGVDKYFLIITIDQLLTYNSYIFHVNKWALDAPDEYFPLLLLEDKKEKLINRSLSDHIKEMNKDEILLYPEKDKLVSYSFL